MKTVKTAINNAALIITLLVISGCSGDTVHVELDNPKHREAYLRLLNEKGFEYEVDESGTIFVKIDSIEKLDNEMKEFDEFIEAEVSKLNEK
ncbi:MAG: hypothetical protein V3V50_01975 [Gammaproteobacteria bacterium]